ncbi:MAG: sulfurtransferase [Prolixibacteraceae bacterium]|jgi:thiosulfate/3-mercaptopyruvate sulfurtransferase|nr:sulfurtransferase [Prolixibacteraceae bacterium]
MKRLSTLIIFFLLAGQLFADGDFASVKEVASKLMDSKSIIIDARSEKEYKAVHIRNAVNIPITELSEKEPIDGILKSKEAIAKIFGDKGVSPDKNIYVYCTKGNNAGRMYWVLKMMGAENVKLLDGNMDAWKAGRKPVTKNPTMVKKAKFPVQMDTKTMLSIDDVKAKMGSAVLVDARADAYFAGTDPKSKGHIKGAISIPSEAMRDEAGLLKSADDLKKIFESKGVTKDKEVMLYCQSSTRAGLLFTILTSVLEYPNVKVYDGAYNEWVAKGNSVVK